MICSAAFSNMALGQSTAPESDMDGVVAQAYDLKNTLTISTTEKTIYREGDGVAVALTHIIGHAMVNDQQIERICSILETAFRYPQLIVNPRNRNPDVSLLLLESARLRSSNPIVKDKIDVLKSHLISIYKKDD
ncbi:hypothetical protein [Tunturiibacter gelidiferens]|uniref:Uncharacterized protein n=1 Tax=Tunturiibacter gelidiferens TaxID=3069689 RepID=A0AAU7Z514_9BACT